MDYFNGLKLILEEVLLKILEQVFSLFETTQGLQTYLLPERRSVFCHISLNNLPLSCFFVIWKL